MHLKTPFRAAKKRDAEATATLIDMAGEGIPNHLWSQKAAPGQNPLEIGRERAARGKGGFSYRNTVVAEIAGSVAAMLLGYEQDDPYETGDLDDLPSIVRPLVELEAEAPGSWYVNALASMPAHRGQGLGTGLLDIAVQRAIETGCETLSLIVADENEGARRLYRSLGYVDRARRPIVPFDGFAHGGDWVLVTRPAKQD